MTMKQYELSWYGHSKNFTSKEAALRFYCKHKNDADKKVWYLVKRDYNLSIIEDIPLEG